jgi:alpha-L-fucosidase 2
MKGSAQFFLDTLVEEPTHHWLVTNPAVSPENAHHHDVSACAGPTMDNQIIRDLFSHVITAAGVLGVDETFVAKVKAAKDRLPPNQIGQAGQLQEWLEDWDTQAPEQNHRHISHLYGLFPSDQIDPRTTPDLAKAAEVTLNKRGDITTGWAIAWRINCWARLGDGDRTYKIVKLLLDPSRTYPNMFDAHPPFQIDGNFGACAAVAEMLMQSQVQTKDGGFEIELLPALPSAWPTGSVAGLRARGGVTVDIAWENAKPSRVALRADRDGAYQLRFGERTWTVQCKAGQAVTEQL